VTAVRGVVPQHHAEYYKNMADNGGDPSVLNLLGHLYFYGARGLKQDFAAAADMFKLAEERVSRQTRFCLALVRDVAPPAGCCLPCELGSFVLARIGCT
jgi:hypothetical protein